MRKLTLKHGKNISLSASIIEPHVGHDW